MKKIPREIFTVGEKTTAEFTAVLPGSTIAPPLIQGNEYEILEIALDKDGNQHLHVGLISKVGWVTSYETGEILPDSGRDGKWWCHPSRFRKIKKESKCDCPNNETNDGICNGGCA